MNNSNRLTFVDWYKAILMLLVVVGHTNLIDGTGGGDYFDEFYIFISYPCFFHNIRIFIQLQEATNRIDK